MFIIIINFRGHGQGTCRKITNKPEWLSNIFLKEETRLKQNLICRYNETVKSIFVIAESMYVTTSKIEKKNKKQIKHNNWR